MCVGKGFVRGSEEETPSPTNTELMPRIDVLSINHAEGSNEGEQTITPPPDEPQALLSRQSGYYDIEVETKTGDRIGMDLTTTDGGSIQVLTNSIGAKPGSILTGLSAPDSWPVGVDFRTMDQYQAAAMIHEANGTIVLHFVAPRSNSRIRTSLIGLFKGTRREGALLDDTDCNYR